MYLVLCFQGFLFYHFWRVLFIYTRHDKRMADFYVVIKYKKKLLFYICFLEHNCRGLRQAAAFVIKFNMQDSFVLPTVWYIERACGPQVAYAWSSAMDESAFRFTVYQIAASLMKRQLAVHFLVSVAIDILFSWQQQQKIQFRTSMLSKKEVKTLLFCLVNVDSRSSRGLLGRDVV
jgi:hypothetical protein